MLKTQLILKNIVSIEDWDEISEHIQYDYVYDNHFSELKENELLNERIQTITLWNLTLVDIFLQITSEEMFSNKRMKK